MVGGPYQVFVYGTLLVPEVMQQVTGRELRGQPATLQGYRRYRLRRCSYPGIVPDPEAEVTGLVYHVDRQSLAALDRYEDPCYERCQVNVETKDGMQRAYAYIIPEARRHLIDPRPWDLDVWRRLRHRQ